MENEALYSLVRTFEGCRLTPYFCPAGVLTVGFGTTGAGVYPGEPWTQEQAEERMKRDVERFVTGTLALCPELSGNRLDAIADFAYNCGLGNLKASTLRKRINTGDWDSAKKELMRWTRGGGKILPGLVRRRAAEVLLLA